MQIPINTLAKGDIIKLLPGDIAPALIELLPFDILEVKKKQSEPGAKFTNPAKLDVTDQRG